LIQQQQEYAAKKLEEHKRFKRLVREGVKPDPKTGKVYDKSTGDVLEDVAISGEYKGRKAFLVPDPVYPGKQIPVMNGKEALLDYLDKIPPTDIPTDDPSFLDASAYGKASRAASNKGNVPSVFGQFLDDFGMPIAFGLDLFADPANIVTFGSKTAATAGRQVTNIMARSFARTGIPAAEAAEKAKAMGRYAAMIFGRDRVPEGSEISKLLADPVGLQDMPRLMSVAEANAQAALVRSQRAAGALEEAQKAGKS
jgi:hypothetical protein